MSTSDSEEDLRQLTLQMDTENILQNLRPLPNDVIEKLLKKSGYSDASYKSYNDDFSSFVRKAYLDILKAYDGRTEVIMKIVANTPDLKIAFLPNKGSICSDTNYETCGLTYAKKGQIYIAAKGYRDERNHKKIQGTIIHEFCHFAIHETFGNEYKPYYAHDESGADKKWEKLVEEYYSRNLEDFPDIK